MKGKDQGHLSRSKEKLKRDIEKEITKLFDTVLDYAEVSVDGKERYKIFRSKVLRCGNDAIREVKKNIDLYYEVDFQATNEDVVEIQRQTISLNGKGGFDG